MNNIRALRKQRQLSMKELGQIVGVAESTISLYENEKREPDLATLSRIADYFNVTVDYLLGRSSDPERDEKPPLRIPDEYKDLPIAFYEGAKGLTQDDIDDVVKFMEFLKKKNSDK